MPSLPPLVSVSFIDPEAMEIRPAEVRMRTGVSPAWMRLRQACNDFAMERGYRRWVQPAYSAKNDREEWWVFERRVSVTVIFQHETRVGAEMWAMHHA